MSALLGMAFFTLLERKFLACVQWRKGPRKVGLVGLPQPLADALKLFLKQRVVPGKVNRLGFICAPVLGLALALVMWLLFPQVYGQFVVPFGGVLFLVVSRLRVYPMLMAGWCSNNNYALLGTMRAIAQVISYEVRMALFLFAALVLLMRYNFSTPWLDRLVWSVGLMPSLFLC